MPCKSTTKLGNLPDHLQSFRLCQTPFMNRRWKVLSKQVDELKSILKRFRSIIGFDPFEHQIVKIHYVFHSYTPFLEKKDSEKKFFARLQNQGLTHRLDTLIKNSEVKPKAIAAKHSLKYKMLKLEDENLLKVFAHLVEQNILSALFGATPQEIRQYMSEQTKQLLEVKKLSLSKLKLTHIPKEILLCKNLKILNISQNLLEFLPDWIGDLEELETINISKNRLYNLPPSFYKLKKLKTIFIHSNKLTHVPLRLSHLPSLKKLVS